MSEQNNNNHNGIENEMLYKLASMEATIKESLRRVDESIKRIEQTIIHDRTLSSDKVKTIEDRLGALEQWKTAFTAKVSVAATGMILVWTFLGNKIQTLMGL